MALTEVSALLVSEYGGTAYSRESIRLIEKAAIAKLKDVEEVQKLWSH
jgi:DNA-directed RNA polymerase sigma subunit (sigma70/sigma32)